jgi:hypothetical protein
VGQAGTGDTRDRSEERHAIAARSVASHPVSPAPILAAVHPDRRERHSQIRRHGRTVQAVQSWPWESVLIQAPIGLDETAKPARISCLCRLSILWMTRSLA